MRNGRFLRVGNCSWYTGCLMQRQEWYPETEASIRRVTDARAERLTAEQVFQLAAVGDKIAQPVVQEVLI